MFPITYQVTVLGNLICHFFFLTFQNDTHNSMDNYNIFSVSLTQIDLYNGHRVFTVTIKYYILNNASITSEQSQCRFLVRYGLLFGDISSATFPVVVKHFPPFVYLILADFPAFSNM